MKRYICVECNKPIRQNSKSQFIHRRCWINIREKEERYLDFLFVRDREKKAKTISVKTQNTELEDTIDEIKDIVNRDKPTEYEEDNSISYVVDIGGNEILI